MKEKMISASCEGAYASPSVTVVCLVSRTIMSGSQGNTQNYESGSIWGAGRDNEPDDEGD